MHYGYGRFEGRCRHGRFGGPRFFGRFGGFTGPGLRFTKMLASGDLQLVVMALLGEKPRYGYEIIKALEERSSGFYTPSPGMVYPALTYLEEMGYTTSEAESNKKLYRITEAGAEYLKKNRASADETLAQLSRFGEKYAQFRKRFEEDDEERDETRGEAGSKAREEFRELRNELKSALYERVEASSEERKRIVAILRRALEEIRGKQN
jgi:DNA-binding PadR family transcriptional regulator